MLALILFSIGGPAKGEKDECEHPLNSRISSSCILALLAVGLIMNLDAVVDELHQIVAEKTPKGTSPQLILERLRASFPPLPPRKVSNKEAKPILLKRGGLSRNRLEKADVGALAAEEVADRIGYNRQGVDHLRKTNRLVALRRGNGKWHYPIWQFEDGHIRAGSQGCLVQLSENT